MVESLSDLDEKALWQRRWSRTHISEVGLRRAWLALGWVTVSVLNSRCDKIYLGIKLATQTSAWPSLHG